MRKGGDLWLMFKPQLGDKYGSMSRKRLVLMDEMTPGQKSIKALDEFRVG